MKAKRLTYPEWLDLHTKKEIEELKEEWECVDCHGSGRCTCRCGHEHDCEECDGVGNFVYNHYLNIFAKENKLLKGITQ